MNFSSTDSTISSADEVTEDSLSQDTDQVKLKEYMEISNHNSGEILSDDKVHSAEQGQEQRSDSSSPTLYAAIRPEHVRILDLHVDPGLKPDYIVSSRDNAWLGTDRHAEESKRQGIMRYLSSGKSVPDLGIAGSWSGQWGRRGSLDDVRQRLRLRQVQGHCDSGDVSQDNDDTEEDSADITKEGGTGPGPLVDELEYQSSLKNESCHFIFAEVLSAGIETIWAEENYHQQRNVPSCQRSPSRTDTDNGISISSPGIIAATFSNAETTAWAFIHELLSLLSLLTSCDGKQRSLPESLQSLRERLDKQLVLSLSLDTNIDHKRPSVPTSTTPMRSERRQSQVTEAMIRAAIGSVTVSVPVGGCPILGPDMSLPCYVVSRSPPAARRSVTLSLQQNTCPGCHSAFQPEVARRLRLCRYYCLYFCSVCHSNTLMLIPARILAKWDFVMLPVSRPARDILQLIHTVPMFALDHFSDSQRHSLRVLQSVCRLRHQGRLLLTFIDVCRQASQLSTLASRLPSHWLALPPLLFAIADLCLMESGHMEPRLRDLVAQYIEHISLCPVCQARGFICEADSCDNKRQVIFPFEMDLVRQCGQCCACFHFRCYNRLKNQSCPRCERRRARDHELHSLDPRDLEDMTH